jgi:hypothetical protein
MSRAMSRSGRPPLAGGSAAAGGKSVGKFSSKCAIKRAKFLADLGGGRATLPASRAAAPSTPTATTWSERYASLSLSPLPCRRRCLAVTAALSLSPSPCDGVVAWMVNTAEATASWLAETAEASASWLAETAKGEDSVASWVAETASALRHG